MKDIKKFTVADYIILTRDCKDVAKAIMLLDSKDKSEQASAFAEVISIALPQVVQVISMATVSTKEEIEKIDDIGLIIDYLFKIVEINNFLALKKSITEKIRAMAS